MRSTNSPITPQHIAHAIYTLRGERVMLDTDLALVYGVTVKRLNEQVRRNRDRFPPDFMFQLNNQEVASLRSQIATLEGGGRGTHRKYLPFAFTEHGAVMAANILSSSVAALAKKLGMMERQYDAQFKIVFDAIRQLMQPPITTRRPIGFRVKRETS